jgi:hypothetical protein
MRFSVQLRWGTTRLTPDKESDVYPPYSSCKHQRDLIFVPKNKADNTMRFCFQKMECERKRTRRTCEVRSKAKRRKTPGTRRSRMGTREQGGHRLVFLEKAKVKLTNWKMTQSLGSRPIKMDVEDRRGTRCVPDS